MTNNIEPRGDLDIYESPKIGSRSDNISPTGQMDVPRAASRLSIYTRTVGVFSCSPRYTQVEEQDLSDDFGRDIIDVAKMILVQLSWVIVTGLKVVFRLSRLPGPKQYETMRLSLYIVGARCQMMGTKMSGTGDVVPLCSPLLES